MTSTEKHVFQAEIRQLLDIVIHSLYTDKEIFVRELISNAADACERLRFALASGQEVYQQEVAPGISIQSDKGVLKFVDTGVGMTHDEMIDNLGTIAHSGTRAFLKQLTEDKKADASLIGQFGVGFYSAFMVSRKVVVLSRSCLVGEQGWRWSSEGAGGYEIVPEPDLPRGTEVILELHEESEHFTQREEIEGIIRRYSNFVQFPIELNGERLNTIQAIWGRNRNEIKDEEYSEFYKFVGRDHEAPLYRMHFTADAPLSIQALLFVPSHNLEILGMTRMEPEVHLYCRKVLVQPKAQGLLPDWLRFLRGVVDSEDLPLNISREKMQDTTLMSKLNKVLTGRFLKFLEEQSEKDGDSYQKFYRDFGKFLKEGAVSDFTHKEAIGKLLRFQSSILEAGKQTSLSEYVSRMSSEQKEIYYLLAPTREAAESSPYFEVFRERKFEVLYLHDPWDEFVMEHLREFEGKPLRSAEKADLELSASPDSPEGLSEDDAKKLGSWIKESLGDSVGEVRVSHRLADSPALIAETDKYMTSSMRRILRSLKREGETPAPAKQDLEINPHHTIMVRLEKLRHSNERLARQVAEQVLDNARVAAGLLEDPRSMLKRLNGLLEELLSGKS